MMGRNVIYVFFLCILSACSQQRILDSVPEYSVTINAEMKKLFLGRPSEIACIDNFLIISDNMGETLLDIYDLKNDSVVCRILNVGQGPNELLPPVMMEASEIDRKINILQRRTSRMSVYSFDDLLQGDDNPQSVLNIEEADRVVSIHDGFIASGFYEGGLFRFFDSEGQSQETVDIYPAYISAFKDIHERYKFGQGYFAYNSVNNLLVFASYFTGDVSFYSVNDGTLDLKSHLSLGNSRFERKLAGGNVNIEGNDIVYSYGAYSTNDYFYILYSGKTMEEEQVRKQGNYILKFDMQGNLVCKYKHDFPIINMCFTSQGDAYAISQSDKLEYNVIKFYLN